MQARTNGEANTHPHGDTCLKLQRGVKRRKKRERAREKGGDCSCKEARERANQWRHDNELFPRQRGS